MATKQPAANAFTKFKQDLRQKTPQHFYIFHGEEDYLRTYYLDMLRRFVLDGPEDFNFHRFSAQTWDISAFSDAVEALPMMAERTFIQIDDVDPYQLDSGDRDALCTALGELPDFCYVVFVFDTLPWKQDKRQRKLTALIDEKAQIVEFAKQSEYELTQWVLRHFTKEGKQISSALCKYLIAQCGGAMTNLAGEISKVIAYSEGTEITQEDIDAVVEPVLDAVIFTLTDAIAGGNYRKSLETLHTLLKMQEEPISILAAIGSQLRKAAAAKALSSAGRGPDALMRMFGMASYPAQKAYDFARRKPVQFFHTALKLCTETDYALKTSADDPQRLLELLILRLAQVTDHG